MLEQAQVRLSCRDDFGARHVSLVSGVEHSLLCNPFDGKHSFGCRLVREKWSWPIFVEKRKTSRVILSRLFGVGDQKEEFIESSLMGKMTFPLLKQECLYGVPTSSGGVGQHIV